MGDCGAVPAEATRNVGEGDTTGDVGQIHRGLSRQGDLASAGAFGSAIVRGLGWVGTSLSAGATNTYQFLAGNMSFHKYVMTTFPLPDAPIRLIFSPG